MEKLTTEQDYLQQVAEIKWEKGYKCKTCKGKEFYNIKKNFARRCKNCGYEETPVKNTMFENSKLSLTKHFEIFHDMQERMEDFLADKYSIDDFSTWTFTFKNAWILDTYFDKYLMRLPNSVFSAKHGINENTLGSLFERIADWVKRGRKFNAGMVRVEEEFLKGLADKKARRIYELVYNFLTYCGKQTFMFPTDEQMIGMAVHKEVYYDWT